MAQNCLNDPKWPFDPKNGLHWTAEENWTKYSFSFLKFIIFVDLERKNEFHGNHATHTLWVIHFESNVHLICGWTEFKDGVVLNREDGNDTIDRCTVRKIR